MDNLSSPPGDFGRYSNWFMNPYSSPQPAIAEHKKWSRWLVIPAFICWLMALLLLIAGIGLSRVTLETMPTLNGGRIVLSWVVVVPFCVFLFGGAIVCAANGMRAVRGQWVSALLYVTAVVVIAYGMGTGMVATIGHYFPGDVATENAANKALNASGRSRGF